MFDFLRRSSPQSPSTLLRRALERDGLIPVKDAPPTLSVVEARGRYSGRSVRYIRVFDSARTSERSLQIRSYGDLDAHRSLVLRAGRVEGDGSVVLDDRGPSPDAAIPVRERADRAAHRGDERFIFPGSFRADAAGA
jgi:hypothetical protein